MQVVMINFSLHVKKLTTLLMSSISSQGLGLFTWNWLAYCTIPPFCAWKLCCNSDFFRCRYLHVYWQIGRLLRESCKVHGVLSMRESRNCISLQLSRHSVLRPDLHVLQLSESTSRRQTCNVQPALITADITCANFYCGIELALRWYSNYTGLYP